MCVSAHLPVSVPHPPILFALLSAIDAASKSLPEVSAFTLPFPASRRVRILFFINYSHWHFVIAASTKTSQSLADDVDLIKWAWKCSLFHCIIQMLLMFIKIHQYMLWPDSDFFLPFRFILKGRREGERFHLLILFLNVFNSQSWTRAKPGARNSTWVVGDPCPAIIHLLPPGVHGSRKLESEGELGLVPRHFHEEGLPPTAAPNACLNSYFRLCSVSSSCLFLTFCWCLIFSGFTVICSMCFSFFRD